MGKIWPGNTDAKYYARYTRGIAATYRYYAGNALQTTDASFTVKLTAGGTAAQNADAIAGTHGFTLPTTSNCTFDSRTFNYVGWRTDNVPAEPNVTVEGCEGIL